MRKSLFFIALLSAFLGTAQSFDGIPVIEETSSSRVLINKLLASPNTSDLTNEYYEFRGTPNSIIPSNLYFIFIEGDGESGKTDMGKVKEAVQLGDGTRTFGSNGIVALVANYTDSNTNIVTTNAYSSVISSDANVIVIELTGTNVNSSSSSGVSTKTPDIGYDGNFTDASGTYMLVAATENPKNVDIDSDNDGIIDATGDHTTKWTLHDSVSILDLDDPVAGTETGEYGYGQIAYPRNYTGNESDFKITTSATIIPQGDSNIIYCLRQGTSTGFTDADWAASGSNGASAPNWKFSGTASKVSPDAFKNYIMDNSIYGELNPTVASLSTESNTFEKVNVYPNPAHNAIFINATSKISEIEIFNSLGATVYKNSKFTGNRIDISNLAKGIYLLKITNGNATTTKKIVKN